MEKLLKSNMEEKNDKLFAIIVIVIVLVLLGGVGYLVFDRVIGSEKHEEKKNGNSNETVISNIDDYRSAIITIPIETCTVDQESVDCNKKHAYSKKKVLIDDISDADKIYTTIAIKDLVKEGEISISDVTEALVGVYGEDGVVKDYEISFRKDYTSFSLNGNKYLLAGGEIHQIDEEYADKMFVTKVTEGNGNLYVYNKNIAYTLKNTEPETTEGNIVIYKNFAKKKEVANIKYKDISDEWLSEYELKKTLMKDYKKYIINFKHTFKYDDSNYYYYSTEPIKK